jgi:Xaa-Pro aminopeptidase
MRSKLLWFAILLGMAGVLLRPALSSELSDDLKDRRARLMERLGPDSILILWSADEKNYSNDVDYEFRQDSNLFYLSGITQPETILILAPGNRVQREILFIKPRNPSREHWEGKLLDKDEASAGSGIATVYLTTEFDSFIDSILSRKPFGSTPILEYDNFFKALEANRGRVHMTLGRQTPNPPLTPSQQFAAKIREKYSGFTITDATAAINGLRQVKTAVEMETMRRSAAISSEAHRAGMFAAQPGAYEYEVEAAIEYTFKKLGGGDWGYPSIVGSGPNATILHYNASSRRMEDGDLLLVDASGNYKGYTVDITRTYPINGQFTQPQREIYSLVLKAQEEAMKVTRAGVTLNAVHQKTVEVIKEGLLELGLITDTTGNQYRTCTHNACHWIGLDVHDVSIPRPLEPGMTFVIEPGIYIQANALDQLPKTPENIAFIEKVRPAFERFKNIGVRVEDSFLLTSNGLERLSATVPRTINEIEVFLRNKPAGFGLR